jgi:UDP-N-acetylmuramyl pentapeptide phosphotransferase/UDP-N-acetylglucosamine-1-phosphate transferase
LLAGSDHGTGCREKDEALFEMAASKIPKKKGLHESKIVTRFWISGIFLAIFTLITLKLR